jgi:MFS superfamily sulfate permease-like transporter
MTTQVLSGLIIGVVVAVVSASVSHLLTRGRDRERWEYEAEAQRERWEREDRVRFQAERQRVYRDYLVGARRARDSAGEEFDEELMVTLLEEIELIASDEVTVAAEEVFTYGNQAMHAGRRFQDNRESGAKFEEVRLRFEESYDLFTNAARTELGVSEESPEQ